MRASPDYLTHGRYAPLEQRGWKLGRSVARHMGFRCARYTGLTRSSRSTGRWRWPRWWAAGAGVEFWGRSEAVEAVLVALQRLVQQTYELALALA